jgi:serine/threonine-protein kinase
MPPNVTERYEVIARLGSGGMATVLLCHDGRLDRRVAVKRLHADSPRDVEHRFLREAKLGASMNHPNLVSVYDTETDDEGVVIVMEYVEGETLAQALLRGPLPAARVASIARDLGEALDHVHGEGVVHRDVKPGNVLLREDGIAKLADLGIAVSVDQTRVTQSGTVLGSAAYMAPEQLEGADVGPAADVYALAAVCFEALTGRKARTGRTPVEIAHSVATTPPPDVRDHAPDLPAAAAAALARGMAREPSERQGSAGELALELANALGGERREHTALARGETRTLPLAAAPAPLAAAPPSPAAPASRTPGARSDASVARSGEPASPTASASRTSASRSTTSASRRSPSFAGPLAAGLIALAAVAVVAAVLLSGGGDGDGRQADRPAQSGSAQRDQAQSNQAERDQARSEQTQSEQEQAEQTPAEPAPAEPAPADQAVDPAQGTALNEQGYALMQQGDYGGAVPVLRKAVASWPEDSTDLNYAYALYNLGVSLNRSGSPDEAIPYLEKRLNWSNQRGIVKKELKDAQQNAGQG